MIIQDSQVPILLSGTCLSLQCNLRSRRRFHDQTHSGTVPKWHQLEHEIFEATSLVHHWNPLLLWWNSCCYSLFLCLSPLRIGGLSPRSTCGVFCLDGPKHLVAGGNSPGFKQDLTAAFGKLQCPHRRKVFPFAVIGNCQQNSHVEILNFTSLFPLAFPQTRRWMPRFHRIWWVFPGRFTLAQGSRSSGRISRSYTSVNPERADATADSTGRPVLPMAGKSIILYYISKYH